MSNYLCKIKRGDLVKIDPESACRVAVMNGNKQNTVLLSTGTFCTVLSDPYTITSHFTERNELAVDCLTPLGCVSGVRVKWLTDLCDAQLS